MPAITINRNRSLLSSGALAGNDPNGHCTECFAPWIRYNGTSSLGYTALAPLPAEPVLDRVQGYVLDRVQGYVLDRMCWTGCVGQDVLDRVQGYVLDRVQGYVLDRMCWTGCVGQGTRVCVGQDVLDKKCIKQSTRVCGYKGMWVQGYVGTRVCIGQYTRVCVGQGTSNEEEALIPGKDSGHH